IGINGVEDWLNDNLVQNTGNGAANNADPMQAGKIVNDVDGKIDDNTVYRYSKALRGTDEGVMDLFRDIVVIDEDGKAIKVPIIWGTQERAVAAILQQNVRKDETLVVDRIKLPMLAISSTGYSFDANRYTYHQALRYLNAYTGSSSPDSALPQNKSTVFGVSRGIPLNVEYTLYAWTMQLEDMNQILEQIVTKFSLVAYIKVRGVLQDVIVKLDSIANNLETEPGDQALRIIKFQFGLTAETYVPMPIKRYDSLIKVFKGDIVDSVEFDSVTSVLGRIRETGA
ncbi:MAG: hypothetical protein EBX77_03935, partial [Actinobacteria bacterium]|nr:hypothetical protein [Actinomycetota bacterium]